MKLVDYLKIPYVLEATTLERADGKWINLVSYPELPECSAEDIVVVRAIEKLEKLRVERIFRLLCEGERPALPRGPLPEADPVWVLERTGLTDRIGPHLQKDEEDLRGSGEGPAISASCHGTGG